MRSTLFLTLFLLHISSLSCCIRCFRLCCAVLMEDSRPWRDAGSKNMTNRRFPKGCGPQPLSCGPQPVQCWLCLTGSPPGAQVGPQPTFCGPQLGETDSVTDLVRFATSIFVLFPIFGPFSLFSFPLSYFFLIFLFPSSIFFFPHPILSSLLFFIFLYIYLFLFCSTI